MASPSPLLTSDVEVGLSGHGSKSFSSISTTFSYSPPWLSPIEYLHDGLVSLFGLIINIVLLPLKIVFWPIQKLNGVNYKRPKVEEKRDVCFEGGDAENIKVRKPCKISRRAIILTQRLNRI